MDASLINVIPNLTARRSVKTSRSDIVSPPPPYTPGPEPSLQGEGEKQSKSDGIPVHFDIVDTSWPEALGKRPVKWSGNKRVALKLGMTYGDLLKLLQEKLDHVKVPQDSVLWKPAIQAKVTGRFLWWQYKKRDVYVTREDWHMVMEAIAEGRLKGFRVTCWRGEVMGEIGN
jgi:hypothetical protein